MSSLSPNTVFRARKSPRQVASPNNLSKERESRSLSGTRPAGQRISPHRITSKYTEPERTSSSSFKPPMSKEAIALKKQKNKSVDPPDSQSTSLFSFLKNVFSNGGSKGTHGTPSTVSSNVADNKSSLIVKVMEKKIDSAKKIETHKDEMHLTNDRVDDSMDKKDNHMSYTAEEMDSETHLSSSTFINESEKDVSLVNEKPVHKKPKVPFSYDPKKLKAPQNSSFFPSEPTEILQPTMLPSLPSDCPGDKLLAAKMKKIEQFKRRHMVPPTVYDPDQNNELIAHTVNSSHSGIRQEFIFPPREIKARRSPSSQIRSNRSESNRSEPQNSSNKWNIDDNMGMSTYKTYKQPNVSPRRPSPHSSNTAPTDGGRPVLQKSSNGYPSYRVQSSPKIQHTRAQSSPKTFRAQSSPKSYRAQNSPKSYRAQNSPKSYQARAQNSPKTYHGRAQSSPKTYRASKTPKKSSSKTREDLGSQKSRIRSKSIPDRMYVSSRSEHATAGSKSIKRHKSVVPAKSNTSQTSLIDDRDIPITYGKLASKGKANSYKRSQMSSNSKSNLATKKTNSKSNLLTKKSNSRSNISAKKTNSNATLYAKRSDSKSNLPVKKSNSRSNVSAQRSDSKLSLSPKHSHSKSNVMSAQKSDSKLNLAAKKSNSRSSLSSKKSNSKLNLATKKSHSRSNISTKKTKSKSNVSSKKSNSKTNLSAKKVNSKTKISVKRTNSNTSQKSIESKKPVVAAVQTGTLEPQHILVSKPISHGYSKQQISTAEVVPKPRRHAMYIYPHQITTEPPSSIDARQTMSAVQQSPTAKRGPNNSLHSSPPNQYSPGSIRKSQSYRYSPERPGSKPTASWRMKKSDKQKKQLSPFRQLISKENSSPHLKDSLMLPGDNRSIGDYSYIYNIDSDDVEKNKSNKDNKKKNSSWASKNKRPSKQQSNSSMQAKNNQSSKNMYASNALQSAMTSRNKNLTKQPRYSSPERPARQSSSGTKRLESPKSRSTPTLQSSSDFNLTHTNVDSGKASPCRPASPRSHMPSPMTSGSSGQPTRSPSIGSIIRKSTDSKDPTPDASLSRFEEAMIVSPLNLEALSFDSHEQNHETHPLASILNPYKLNQSSKEVIEYVQDYPPEGDDYLVNSYRTDAPWENSHRDTAENYANEDNINLTSTNHNRSATSFAGDQCNSATPNFFNFNDYSLDTSRSFNFGFDDYILMNCSNSSIYKSPGKWSDDEMQTSLTHDPNRMISSSTSRIFTDCNLHADMDVIPTASLVGHSSRPQASPRAMRRSPVDELLKKDEEHFQHPISIVHLSAIGSNSPNTPSNKNRSPIIKNSSRAAKVFGQRPAPASKAASFYNTKDDPRFRMGREARSREITCCSPAKSRSQNNTNKIPSITMGTSKRKEVLSRSNSPNNERKSFTPRPYRPPARELSTDDSRPIRGASTTNAIGSQKPSNSPLRYRGSIEYPPSFLSPLNLGPKKPEPRIGSNVNGTKPKVIEPQSIKRKSRSMESTRRNDDDDDDTSSSSFYKSPILSNDVINKTISFFSTIFNSVDETIKNATKRESDVEVIEVSSDFLEPPPPKSSFQESLKKDRAESPWLMPMPDTAVGNKTEEKAVLETIKKPVASSIEADTDYDELSSPVDTPHAFVSSATRNEALSKFPKKKSDELSSDKSGSTKPETGPGTSTQTHVVQANERNDKTLIPSTDSNKIDSDGATCNLEVLEGNVPELSAASQCHEDQVSMDGSVKTSLWSQIPVRPSIPNNEDFDFVASSRKSSQEQSQEGSGLRLGSLLWNSLQTLFRRLGLYDNSQNRPSRVRLGSRLWNSLHLQNTPNIRMP